VSPWPRSLGTLGMTIEKDKIRDDSSVVIIRFSHSETRTLYIGMTSDIEQRLSQYR
jgi:hypothetical protein